MDWMIWQRYESVSNLDSFESLQERKEIMEKFGRNRKAVQLNVENQKKLEVIKTQLENMKKLLSKEIAKGKGGFFGTKLTEEEIKTREEVIEQVEFLVKDMHILFHEGKAGAAVDNRIASTAKKDMDRIREERAAKAAKAKKGNKGQPGTTAAGEDEGLELQPLSHEDQLFMESVMQRDAQIDAKLDQVLQGVVVLRKLGEEISDELQTQAQILKEVDVKVDKTTKKFVVANKKMKELLEESGGATRWCPIIIFVIVIVALIGYVLSAKGLS